MGIKRAKEIIRACRELGIEVLTLYAFSTENWNRPRREISTLMSLLKRFLSAEGKTLVKNNIRLNAIGSLEDLPGDVRDVLNEVMQQSRHNTGMVLNAALSYSGRNEILQAVKNICRGVSAGIVDPSLIDERLFSDHLYTAGLPDPDLLIRTSGEYRISNFLLWQTAYTELYITGTLWPDFTKKDLHRAIADYGKRERRFGLTRQQIHKQTG
ncbi:MAG: pyrophosphate synthase [Deltaproteobacteria bacterium]|nr:pyrophosphate synthase [Deltaproteobacteria bacterium]